MRHLRDEVQACKNAESPTGGSAVVGSFVASGEVPCGVAEESEDP